MTLDEFKFIFYWEYFHRLLARFIGLFFLIPLIYFYFTKKINVSYIKNCFLIFFLISVQGLVGWYMVKSGLIDNVTVSHYRLSLHLSLAIIIISSIFWLLINIINKTNLNFFKISKKNFFYQFLIILIFLQLIIGAFVSGLDAGRIYQTWPLMGRNYFPDDIILNDLSNFFEFKNHSLIQFYHRNFAYFISIYVFLLALFILKKKIRYLYNPLKILILILVLQILMGIITLISGLNIYFASAHQIMGVFLVISALNLYYFSSK